MSKNTSRRNAQSAKANQTPETNNNLEPVAVQEQTPTAPAPVENQDPQTANTEAQPETAPAEFEKVELFPTLDNGMKFEVNGYKVTITKKEYQREEKFPYTAFDAVVIAPDGTTKDFQKVRNTAIKNYCHASTGITHNGNESGKLSKVLTDTELAAEVTRRCQQVRGLLDRAEEIYKRYTGASLHLPEIDLNTPITAKLTEDNNQKKADNEKAATANKVRQARKETRDLQAEIAALIAAGNFAKAAELMQQKATAKAEAEKPEQETE